MTQLKEQTATYADIEALPPHVVGEILFGHLVTHPRPAPRHGGAVVALGALCTPSYQFGTTGPGGWIFIVEPELHIGSHVVVPDLAGWRAERLLPVPDKAYFETAPDWICEVLSPSTEKYDKGDKRRIYAQYGVEHLWYVEPRAQTLEVFVRQDKDWLLTHTFTDVQEVTAPPFLELTFKLGLLWPLDQPTDDHEA